MICGIFDFLKFQKILAQIIASYHRQNSHVKVLANFFLKFQKIAKFSKLTASLSAEDAECKSNHVTFGKGKVQGSQRTIDHIDTTPTTRYTRVQTFPRSQKMDMFEILENMKFLSYSFLTFSISMDLFGRGCNFL